MRKTTTNDFIRVMNAYIVYLRNESGTSQYAFRKLSSFEKSWPGAFVDLPAFKDPYWVYQVAKARQGYNNDISYRGTRRKYSQAGQHVDIIILASGEPAWPHPGYNLDGSADCSKKETLKNVVPGTIDGGANTVVAGQGKQRM